MNEKKSDFDNPLNQYDQAAYKNIFIHNSELKWEEVVGQKGSASLNAMPKGLKRAIIFGDPDKEGLCIFRMHYPAHFRVPAHIHWMAEHTAVLSGEVHFGLGEKFDESKLMKFVAGDFFTVGAGVGHFVDTKDSSPIFELHVMGPWRMSYCNPDDHPHN